MPYAPTQEGVLDYAAGCSTPGSRPGVLMIDDRWSQDYGVWRFDPTRVPRPAGMITHLHDWGFAVMLWLVPFVSPDSETRVTCDRARLLVRGPDGRPAVREWWNGFSAVLDVTHPDAVGWLHARTRCAARRRTGSTASSSTRATCATTAPPTSRTPWHGPAPASARPGRGSGRATRSTSFAPAGRWAVSRSPSGCTTSRRPGDGHGLASLIPEVVAQGLIGHPFGCPDMVGGGDSAGSWRPARRRTVRPVGAVLRADPDGAVLPRPAPGARRDHLAAVTEAVALRQRLLPELLALVADAARTGEPILRSPAYDDPAYAEPGYRQPVHPGRSHPGCPRPGARSDDQAGPHPHRHLGRRRWHPPCRARSSGRPGHAHHHPLVPAPVSRRACLDWIEHNQTRIPRYLVRTC